MPKEIREVTNCDVNTFKGYLDSYLKNIPDEPQVPGYTVCRRAETNSLIDMVELSRVDDVDVFEGGHPWKPDP